ncbi:MAG: hypothetical protein ACPGOV_02900 [Magnetovibrionaceae bacterium]
MLHRNMERHYTEILRRGKKFCALHNPTSRQTWNKLQEHFDFFAVGLTALLSAVDMAPQDALSSGRLVDKPIVYFIPQGK